MYKLFSSFLYTKENVIHTQTKSGVAGRWLWCARAFLVTSEMQSPTSPRADSSSLCSASGLSSSSSLSSTSHCRPRSRPRHRHRHRHRHPILRGPRPGRCRCLHRRSTTISSRGRFVPRGGFAPRGGIKALSLRSRRSSSPRAPPYPALNQNPACLVAAAPLHNVTQQSPDIRSRVGLCISEVTRKARASRNTIEWPSWWPRQYRRGIWLCYK